MKSVKELLSGKGEMIPLFKVFMPESVMGPLKETLFSGYIGEGPKVKEFEEKLIPWFENKYVLATNSGTSAIHLALRLIGAGYGDEVISTPMTCTATNVPILERGAKIVWADIFPKTGNIDFEDVFSKITNNTKAIICVDWGGCPCDLEELDDAEMWIVEDACHAFGAIYQQQLIGSYSDFTCFSFQAIKEITTIDGGALCCTKSTHYERGKKLRWFGIDREQNRKDFRCETDIAEYGYKFHMNDVAATIGIEQLKYVNVNLSSTKFNAQRYNDAFQELKTIKRQYIAPDRQSSYWLYTLLVDDRPAFVKHMHNKGIVVSQVHARNDKHTMFKQFQAHLPGVDEFSRKNICIPVGWWLTPEEVDYIIESVQEFDVGNK